MEQLTRKTTRITATQRHCRSPRAGARAGTQKGVVLFIALIVLVAMTLAGIALVRSVDTANVIAGNFAFKQATLQAGDIGVEAAVAELPNIIATSLESNLTPVGGTNPNYWYYATRRELDTQGVPTTKEYGATGTATAINWNNLPVAVASTLAGNNEVRVVIDRLCQGPAPVTDLQGKCFADAPLGGGSKKAGGVVFSGTTTVYYRVTVRVSGPRNTVSMVQAILGR